MLSHSVVSSSCQARGLQVLLSMEFSRQEYCSGWPFPSPGDLPGGIEPLFPALQAILYYLSHQGSLGHSPWGGKRVGHNLATEQQQ